MAKAPAHVPAPRTEVPEPDLRARILRASVELIGEQGLDALSMREVARRAGVSHQAPYHHFDDRAAILAALAEEGFTELRRRMYEARTAPRKSPGEIARAGTAYVQFALAFPAHFRVMFRPDIVDTEKYAGAHCKAEEAFAELVTIVDKWVKEGEGWEGKEPILISLFWSLSHGLASLLLDGPLRAKQPQAAAQVEEHVHDVMRVFTVMADAALKRGDQVR
jgi:AcrR family transcriptional regulator